MANKSGFGLHMRNTTITLSLLKVSVGLNECALALVLTQNLFSLFVGRKVGERVIEIINFRLHCRSNMASPAMNR